MFPSPVSPALGACTLLPPTRSPRCPLDWEASSNMSQGTPQDEKSMGFPMMKHRRLPGFNGKNGTNGSCNDKHIEFIMGHEFPRNPQKKITMSSFPISFYAIIFPWDFHLSQVSPCLWGFFHVMLPCYIEHARAAPCERLTKTFKAKDLASKKKAVSEAVSAFGRMVIIRVIALGL